MRALWWKAQDAIDYALDHYLSDDSRWALIDCLMRHGLSKACRVDGYFWAYDHTDSIFELGQCTRCRDAPYTYCGKERP